VEGRLETRSYDDKDGKKVYATDVVCEHLVLLGGRQDSGGAPEEYSQQPVSMPRGAGRSAAGPVAAPAPSNAPHDDSGFNQGITDDDVPF
jgi:single-strand DNA-binding protein